MFKIDQMKSNWMDALQLIEQKIILKGDSKGGKEEYELNETL